jgi:16S rRNA (guanine(1405)-N(7))-methyltransferase
MDEETLGKLVELVMSSPRYKNINGDLVRHIGIEELTKRKNLKEAVKFTRSKLHQVGGAYQEKLIDYASYIEKLRNPFLYSDDSQMEEFCLGMMGEHSSTRERLPVIRHFFQQTLDDISPITSILDLACGLNPLAIPWMPVSPDIEYHACDIYLDMVGFLYHYFKSCGLNGSAEVCDLTRAVPQHRVQLVFLLKTIPCLEQLEKDIASKLLRSITADHILISYPSRSLGGKSKGMAQFYESQFQKLVEGMDCSVHRFEFPNELVFRLDFISKKASA